MQPVPFRTGAWRPITDQPIAGDKSPQGVVEHLIIPKARPLGFRRSSG
jgi:hypothetical protein